MRKKAKGDSHLKTIIGSIDIHSSVAVYAQIENCIRFAIASGALKSGDKLPSVSALAGWLELNPNTVMKAYRDLEVVKLLYSVRGTGVFVADGAVLKCRESCRIGIISRTFEVVREAMALGMSKSELVAVTKACIKVESSPYGEVPKEIMALAKKREE